MHMRKLEYISKFSSNYHSHSRTFHSSYIFLWYTWENLYKAIKNQEEKKALCTISGINLAWWTFMRRFIYKEVKKSYKSAEHLMLCSTKAYVCRAFMCWVGLENVNLEFDIKIAQRMEVEKINENETQESMIGLAGQQNFIMGIYWICILNWGGKKCNKQPLFATYIFSELIYFLIRNTNKWKNYAEQSELSTLLLTNLI